MALAQSAGRSDATATPVTSAPAPASAAMAAPTKPGATTEPKANAAVDPKSDTAGALDRARAVLDQIVAALQRDSLGDQALQQLRSDLDPAAALAQNAIDDLVPREDALRARIDQLGPKPDAKAPPESPAVATERAQQQRLLDDADEQLKRGRLLLVQIQQTGSAIVARRRAIFVKELFQRTQSLFSPKLWIAVANDTPAEVKAFGLVARDYASSLSEKLRGWRGSVFLGLIALIAFLNIPLARVVRRILSREPSVAEPGLLTKALAATWVAIIVAILPLATVVSIFSLGEQFDLSAPRLAPLKDAIIGAVARVALTAGLARGLLAPSRPNWRMIAVGDETASLLMRLAMTVATMVSGVRIGDAINESLGASLPVTAATQGVGAFLVALVIAVALLRIGVDPDETQERRTASQRYLPVLRAFALAVCFVVILATVAGYIRFAAFLLDQIIWACAIGAIVVIVGTLVVESIEAGFQPTTALGRFFTANLGVSRDGVTQLGVVLSGLARLTIIVCAILLLVAPWGIGSEDLQPGFAMALLGFSVGNVEISPRSIVGALALFGLIYAATHAIQNWLTDRFLPSTRLDAGLRNAIRTSAGYVGVILAVLVALAYIGLGFDKLTIVAGALSVGIGFGLQSIVSNFVSGLILLWEGVIRVGDLVVVGSDQGFVRRINVRSTEIETPDRNTMVVPNSNLITGVVKNWARTDRVARISIPVTLHTGADPATVRDIMVTAAKSHANVSKIPAPTVLFLAMDPSGLKFELVCFVDDFEQAGSVKSDLNYEIFRSFQEKGIEIATPAQVVVSVDRAPEGLIITREKPAAPPAPPQPSPK